MVVSLPQIRVVDLLSSASFKVFLNGLPLLFTLNLFFIIYLLINFLMNIYIANLSYGVNEADLKELFSEYGEVSSAKVITDRETGRSRGFGFVEMPNNDEANKAIENMNGVEIKGWKLNVNEARPKEEGNKRQGSGFRRQGSGGRR